MASMNQPKNDPQKRVKVLLIDDREQRRDALEAELQAIGYEIVGISTRIDKLLFNVHELEPDVIIMDMDSPSRDALESLKHLKANMPKPVVMFADDDDGQIIRRSVEAGVSAYIVDGMQPGRVQSILHAAIARFEHFTALEQELHQTKSELEERKLIDRAKALIMQQRKLSEPEAYQALRKASMSSGLRVADVAQQVIQAADLLL